MPPPPVPTPIVQFGTSRFLQAHAALFIDEAMRAGQGCGPVAVVQTTGDPVRAARLAALAAPEGYPVRIRGREGGRVVDATRRVRSVRRTLSTATDWDAVVALLRDGDGARVVLSNTGERGFEARPADAAPGFDQAMSYPAKLTLLLRARFAAGGAPLTILPTELLVRNGDALKRRVLALAGGEGAFRDWLEDGVIWANSLVDRIVSEPIDPAGAVAEPYALWAIEDRPGLILPCTHPAIVVVDTLAGIEALKLFVLNLGHTVLAERWREARGGDGVLVRHLVGMPEELARLKRVLQDEVRPAFVAAGSGDRFDDYVETTLERFANPFLDHRIADIAQNHPQKITRRIVAMLDWARANGDMSEKPILSAIAARSGMAT